MNISHDLVLNALNSESYLSPAPKEATVVCVSRRTCKADLQAAFSFYSHTCSLQQFCIKNGTFVKPVKNKT